MIVRISCLMVALSAAALSGCAQSITAREQYVFQVKRDLTASESPPDGTLEVRRLTIDAAFAGKNLVYRLKEFEYEADYYREFLVPPAVLITEQTREWLSASRVFAEVVPLGSRIPPTYTLEGNVTALYGDFRDGPESAAVLEIRYFLLKNGDPQETILFAETYRAREPLPAKTPEALIESLNKALAGVLSRLETDIQRVLPARSGEAARAGGPQNLPST